MVVRLENEHGGLKIESLGMQFFYLNIYASKFYFGLSCLQHSYVHIFLPSTFQRPIDRLTPL